MAYSSKTTLITTTELKALTPLSTSVDDDKLTNAILYCQDVFIAPALGDDLYEDIIDDVAADSISAANEVLLEGNDYSLGGIKVTLAWYAYWKALTYINYSTTKKGVVKRADPNSEPTTLDDFNVVRSEALSTADGYLRNLIEYLKEDAVLDTPTYPLYTTGVNEGTTEDPRNGGSGIVL